MPCIQIKTNVSVSEEAAQAVKSQLGQIITCLPEKTEDWLMITLEDGCRMWFRGEKDKPMAIVEVKVFGDSVDRAASERMTREVCGLFQQQLGVDPRDLYVRYLATPEQPRAFRRERPFRFSLFFSRLTVTHTKSRSGPLFQRSARTAWEFFKLPSGS